MNIIVRREFKLAYYDVVVQQFSHYATDAPTITKQMEVIKRKKERKKGRKEEKASYVTSEGGKLSLEKKRLKTLSCFSLSHGYFCVV